ncbi:MAG: ABC transporter ATP-binding protein, partial [Prosthecobacter sp.]
RGESKAVIAERVRAAAGILGLAPYLERYPRQLSGGQRQRVAMGRAIVRDPQVFLFDEPLSNLDAKLRLEMRSEIRGICKEHGLTAIYVTHDRDEALSMADRIAIMESGKIAQLGTPTEVYRNPATRMVAEFIGETNFIEGRTLRASSREGFYDVETPFGQFRGRTNDTSWQPAPGQPVILSIRPEALTFANLTDSPNRFTGQIIDTTYLGATAQYLLQVQGGPLMKVCEINPQHVRPPSAEETRAMAAMNDVVILRK